MLFLTIFNFRTAGWLPLAARQLLVLTRPVDTYQVPLTDGEGLGVGAGSDGECRHLDIVAVDGEAALPSVAVAVVAHNGELAGSPVSALGFRYPRHKQQCRQSYQVDNLFHKRVFLINIQFFTFFSNNIYVGTKVQFKNEMDKFFSIFVFALLLREECNLKKDE